ncbi:MAG: sulfatase-like hydrolase/transferase [Bacteroidales bacterium]
MILSKNLCLTKVFALLLIASLSLTGCNERADNNRKPNVLIILTDDMGYGEISCYNPAAVHTAHIDRLAYEGVRFTDFYVPTPYCGPSRGTLLTGRFPLRNGLIRNPTPDAGINDIGIDADEITLGEVFQEAGYSTMLIGKWHLGHKEEYFPVKHGFDNYYGILYSNDMRPVQHVENMDTVEFPIDQKYLTKRYTELAIEYIRKQGEHPFFLHLCHPMPHKPLAASDEFYTPETPEDLYDDVIRELDWSTGELLKTLEEEGILDNTIIVFMSDNGASYGGNNTPLKGRKHYTWEGGTRVPFIIRFPQVLPEGETVTTPCWSSDLFPTVLSLSGIPIPENLVLDGENIEPLMNGEEMEQRPIFTMRQNQIRTIRKGDWKLFIGKPRFHQPVDLETWSDWRAPDGTEIIAPFEQATPAQYPGVKPEMMEGDVFLFNLREDISEMNNVAAQYPEIIKELTDDYNAFIASLPELDDED